MMYIVGGWGKICKVVVDCIFGIFLLSRWVMVGRSMLGDSLFCSGRIFLLMMFRFCVFSLVLISGLIFLMIIICLIKVVSL